MFLRITCLLELYQKFENLSSANIYLIQAKYHPLLAIHPLIAS
jgi:hypothetical protein